MTRNDDPPEDQELPKWYLDIEEEIIDYEEEGGSSRVADILKSLLDLFANEKWERENKEEAEALASVHAEQYHEFEDRSVLQVAIDAQKKEGLNS